MTAIKHVNKLTGFFALNHQDDVGHHEKAITKKLNARSRTECKLIVTKLTKFIEKVFFTFLLGAFQMFLVSWPEEKR